MSIVRRFFVHLNGIASILLYTNTLKATKKYMNQNKKSLLPRLLLLLLDTNVSVRLGGIRTISPANGTLISYTTSIAFALKSVV